MTNRRLSLAFVLEGAEEACFFNIVQGHGVAPCFDLHFLPAIENGVFPPNGAQRVGSFFHDAYSNEAYDLVFCLYDVDYRQNEKGSPFNDVQDDLLEVLGSQEAVDQVSLCTNPNILQYLLLGVQPLDQVALLSGSKRTNTPIVHQCWPEIGRPIQNQRGQDATKHYDARDWQLEIIKNSYTYGPASYDVLLANAEALSMDYLCPNHPGGNLLPVLKALKEGNIEFFLEIKKRLNTD